MPTRLVGVCFSGTRFAAMSEDGEVVRGKLDGTELERIRVTGFGTRRTNAGLRCNEDYFVLVWNNLLLRWTDRLEIIAGFEDDIDEVGLFGSRVLLSTRDRSASLIDLTTAERKPIPAYEKLAPGPTRIALQIKGSVQILELDSQLLWPAACPAGLRGAWLDEHLLVGSTGHVLWRCFLPHERGELRSHLERLTNAVESPNGVLLWPWQVH